MEAGTEAVVAVSMLELLSCSTVAQDVSPSGVVHDVHCLTRGDVAVMPSARSWITVDGDRPTRSRRVLGGTSVTRNGLEAHACGHEARFADRSRPTGQTVGPLPLGWS